MQVKPLCFCLSHAELFLQVVLRGQASLTAQITSPFEKYAARPIAHEDLTFMEYFKQFSLERTVPAKLQGQAIERDRLNAYLIPRKGLVRFNDPHPCKDLLARLIQTFILSRLTVCYFNCSARHGRFLVSRAPRKEALPLIG